MNKTVIAAALAGIMIAVAAMPAITLAWQGQGVMRGQTLQTPRNADQMQARQQLRDGSCLNGGTCPGVGTGTGTAANRGIGYGPGNGTGNAGVRPQNDMGYGAPINR